MCFVERGEILHKVVHCGDIVTHVNFDSSDMNGPGAVYVVKNQISDFFVDWNVVVCWDVMCLVTGEHGK